MLCHGLKLKRRQPLSDPARRLDIETKRLLSDYFRGARGLSGLVRRSRSIAAVCARSGRPLGSATLPHKAIIEDHYLLGEFRMLVGVETECISLDYTHIEAALGVDRERQVVERSGTR